MPAPSVGHGAGSIAWSRMGCWDVNQRLYQCTLYIISDHVHIQTYIYIYRERENIIGNVMCIYIYMYIHMYVYTVYVHISIIAKDYRPVRTNQPHPRLKSTPALPPARCPSQDHHHRYRGQAEKTNDLKSALNCWCHVVGRLENCL